MWGMGENGRAAIRDEGKVQHARSMGCAFRDGNWICQRLYLAKHATAWAGTNWTAVLYDYYAGGT